MSKRRFLIPSGAELAADHESNIDAPSAARSYFKPGSCDYSKNENAARTAASGDRVGAAFWEGSALSRNAATPADSKRLASVSLDFLHETSARGGGAKQPSISLAERDPPVKHNVVATQSLARTGTSIIDIPAPAISRGALRPGALVVNPRQKGNPVLKHVRRVPWEFGETVADYEVGRANCALYLSLKYHNLHPQYVHQRLRDMGRAYDLRILLALVDVTEPSHPLKELAKVCVLADCTLIVAFTPEEAARYLEIYKTYEYKPPDLLMERPPEAGDLLARAVDCLTTVKSVNKTDASTLMTRFGTMDRIVNADEDDLCLCTGFGPQKAKRLYQACHEPFIAAKKEKKPPITPSKRVTNDVVILP